MYKNHEGYSDPTVGAVMKKLMTEYNRKKRARRRKTQKTKTSGKAQKEGKNNDSV